LGSWKDLVTGLPLRSRTLKERTIINKESIAAKVRVISII